MQTRIGDIHAGLPDAKDDIRLNEWQFMESYVIPPKFHIGNLINGNIYYIIGNKGLGKTAAMRYLALMLRKDNRRTVTSFLLFEQDYTHQGKTGMESAAVRPIITYDMEHGQSLDVTDFSLVWRWHLYLRMVEVNSEGSIFVQDRNWKKFSGFVLGISKCEPRVTVSGGLEIRLPENLPFFHFIRPHISIELPEFEIGSRDYSFEEAMAEADACFEKLQRRDTPFYFFIDELDVYYGDERNYIRDLRLVHDLVTEVKRMNLLIHDLQWSGIKLFCTLRPEVIRAIDNHLPAKNLAREMEGFCMILSWVSETEETFTSPIMKLFLKRIEKAEEANGEAGGSDAARYSRWFPDRIDGMEPSDYIQFITWSRPRDIVRLLRAAQSARGADQAFTKYVFQALLREYSSGSLDEIKGELEASYPGPEIRKLMLCFQDLPERFTLVDFQEGIDDVYGQDEKRPDAAAILSDLYRVGAIGQVTGNRVRWAYKGDMDFRIRKSQVNIVHKGLIHALCVSPEKESQTGNDDRIDKQEHQQAETGLKNREQEEAERQRLETERKKQEQEEAERRRLETERRKREQEEAERRRLETERRKREQEEAERRLLEADWKKREQKEAEHPPVKKNSALWILPVVLCLCMIVLSLLKRIPLPPTSETFTKIGSIVEFGRYPQEAGSTQEQPIEWVVLDVEEDRSLLISRYALDVKEYNKTDVDISWKTCTLQRWLNHDFLKTAFTEEEQTRIPVAEISNPDNTKYGTAGGNNSKDQVFLLSIDEAKKYYEDDEDRICMPTQYALAKNENIMYSELGAGCWWWLRSPGRSNNVAADVDPSGALNNDGIIVDFGSVAVRPALWINL